MNTPSGSGTSNSNVVGNRLSVAIISSSITAGTILCLDMCFAFARRPLLDLGKRLPVYTEASYVAVALGAMSHDEVRHVIHELRQLSNLSSKEFEARWLFGIRKMRSLGTTTFVTTVRGFLTRRASSVMTARSLPSAQAAAESASGGARPQAVGTSREDGGRGDGAVPPLGIVPPLNVSRPEAAKTDDKMKGCSADTSRTSASPDGWTARDLVGSLTDRTDAGTARTPLAGAVGSSSAVNLASVTLAMARLHDEQREALHQLLIGMFRRRARALARIQGLRVDTTPSHSPHLSSLASTHLG